MKRIFLSGWLLFAAALSSAQTDPPSKKASEPTSDSFYLLTPVEVRAIRANDNAPFTKTNIGKKEIVRQNLGADLPFLLNQTPSVVVNSDAGNGIGYTGIRIRGTDATRINVTLNGIPYNDAESQGTFFVDLPDFASSVGSIQVQRGAGTSSNGAGAFGASINLSTNEVNADAYAELNNSYGSFNTWKNTVKTGSGLKNGFTTEARLSNITSDGFIDRARSELRSFYVTSAYISKKSSVRANVFSGKEKTYQAWYGISEADLESGNRTVNYAGTEKPGAPYENETDNFIQTHYQLFFSHLLGAKIQFNTAAFLTKGKGYYEQYKAGEEYAAYGLPDPPSGGLPVTTSDMVRQLWLDNDFYGNIFSFQYRNNKTQATLGGAVTRYDGKHFGKVIWAEKGLTGLKNWYDIDSRKTDFNVYLKQQTQVHEQWTVYYDLQYRRVDYRTEGFRNNPGLGVNVRYHFFNPKAGISYKKNNWKSYLSFSVAAKEPNRDDFEAASNEVPRPERLYDAEAGIERSHQRYSYGATFYYMHYKDQLVLTGKINDVGAYTRTNIPVSYRAGVELTGQVRFSKWLLAAGNLSLSSNKVNDFTEYIDDYDNGGQKTNRFSKSDLAFSPSVVGGATVTITPFPQAEISVLNKYVSTQYLDNTSDKTRMLAPFFVQDLQVSFTLKRKIPREAVFIIRMNNVWDNKYEPNGYTYSYFAGGNTVTENFYFPMAGRNIMAALNIRF